MFGFGKNKRIVLFDTLLEQCKENQILSILCHEIGHWVYSHTLKNLLAMNTHMLAIFYAYSLAINDEKLITSFGFSASEATRSTTIGTSAVASVVGGGNGAVILSLFTFFMIISPIEQFIGFLFTLL